MICPACKSGAQCSACLAEELARRGQEQVFTKTATRKRGRPTKGLEPLTVYVSPGFKERIKKGAGKAALAQGEWLERQCG